MTIKTPQSWLPQPLGRGSVSTVANSAIVDQLGNFIVDQLGDSIVTGTQLVQAEPLSSWTNNLNKTAAAWLPQPLGYGYVSTVTALNLVTQTGAILVTQAGAKLNNGTARVVGKSKTTWAETGA